MFKEFTIINPETNTEVMVDINTKTGKIDDLYCYANDIPVLYNDETDKEYKISAKEGKNKLFVHIQRKSTIYANLLKCGFIFCLDEADQDYNNDVALIEKSLIANNIGQLNAIN